MSKSANKFEYGNLSFISYNWALHKSETRVEHNYIK